MPAGSIIVDLLHEEKKFRLWVGQGEFRFEKILILQTSIGGGGVEEGPSFISWKLWTMLDSSF